MRILALACAALALGPSSHHAEVAPVPKAQRPTHAGTPGVGGWWKGGLGHLKQTTYVRRRPFSVEDHAAGGAADRKRARRATIRLRNALRSAVTR